MHTLVVSSDLCFVDFLTFATKVQTKKFMEADCAKLGVTHDINIAHTHCEKLKAFLTDKANFLRADSVKEGEIC